MYRESPPGLAGIFQEAARDAMERWLEAARGQTRSEAAQAFAEISPIAAKHWGDILERIWAAYSPPPKGKDFFTVQRELHLASVASLNEMMKEVMGTKSFAAWTGESVEAYLKAKIASDRTMEELLKSMRIPTKTDFDDLTASIQSLGEKVDAILARERVGGPDRRARREG